MIGLASFHIASGTALVILGLAALLLAKGSGPHRLAGQLFVLAMLSLVVSGAALGFLRPDVPDASVLGLLTLYLAATGWRTARRKDGGTGAFEVGAVVLAVLTALAAFATGWHGLTDPSGVKDQMFAPIALVIGALALGFAALDVRVIVRGGLVGRARIARHVWRMGFSAFFAAAAGLEGQLLRFPEAARPYLHAVVLATLVLTLFWLVRVRFTRPRQMAAGA